MQVGRIIIDYVGNHLSRARQLTSSAVDGSMRIAVHDDACMTRVPGLFAYRGARPAGIGSLTLVQALVPAAIGSFSFLDKEENR